MNCNYPNGLQNFPLIAGYSSKVIKILQLLYEIVFQGFLGLENKGSASGIKAFKEINFFCRILVSSYLCLRLPLHIFLFLQFCVIFLCNNTKLIIKISFITRQMMPPTITTTQAIGR